MELKRISIDTSKHVFTLHGVDGEDRVVLRRRRLLWRGEDRPEGPHRRDDLHPIPGTAHPRMKEMGGSSTCRRAETEKMIISN